MEYKGRKTRKYRTDVESYALAEMPERGETDERTLAERCIEAGKFVSVDCSSAIDLMPSLIKRLK
ncbi:MAG: hypothetical protein AABX50_00330 [Nanoarchaeota archaeon]